MKKREKDFQNLVGITIKKVDASAVNQLVLYDSEENEFVIDVELDGFSIPHLTFTKVISD